MFKCSNREEYALLDGVQPVRVLKSFVGFTKSMITTLDRIGAWADSTQIRLHGYNDTGSKRVVLYFISKVLEVVEVDRLSPFDPHLQRTDAAYVQCLNYWNECVQKKEEESAAPAAAEPLSPMKSSSVSQSTTIDLAPSAIRLVPGDYVEYYHHIYGNTTRRIFRIKKEYGKYMILLDNDELLSGDEWVSVNNTQFQTVNSIKEFIEGEREDVGCSAKRTDQDIRRIAKRLRKQFPEMASMVLPTKDS